MSLRSNSLPPAEAVIVPLAYKLNCGLRKVGVVGKNFPRASCENHLRTPLLYFLHPPLQCYPALHWRNS